jgi:hypothetical protein
MLQATRGVNPLVARVSEWGAYRTMNPSAYCASGWRAKVNMVATGERETFDVVVFVTWLGRVGTLHRAEEVEKM